MDAEAFMHAVSDATCQREQLRTACIPVIDQHQRMPGRNTRIAIAMAFPAGLVD